MRALEFFEPGVDPIKNPDSVPFFKLDLNLQNMRIGGTEGVTFDDFVFTFRADKK
jgi:hypothetical protein